MAADRPGQKHSQAPRRLLDGPLPITRVVRAKLHHRARENGRVGGITSQHGKAAIGLLEHDIAELWIHSSQLAHQPVAHELRRRKTAVPKRGWFQVRAPGWNLPPNASPTMPSPQPPRLECVWVALR